MTRIPTRNRLAAATLLADNGMAWKPAADTVDAIALCLEADLPGAATQVAILAAGDVLADDLMAAITGK